MGKRLSAQLLSFKTITVVPSSLLTERLILLLYSKIPESFIILQVLEYLYFNKAVPVSLD